MRIALCLSGLLGGLSGKNGNGRTIDPRNGYYWFNKNILKNHIVDVFFHTWGDFDDNLISLYKPKKYVFEKKSEFLDIDYKFYNCSSYYELYKKEYKLNNNYVPNIEEINVLKDQIFRSNSKWASVYKSINLKKEYEYENNFKYDFVIIARFDIALTKKLEFSKLKKNIIYLSKRDKNQLARDSSFNDLIFLGDSQIIDLFAEIFTKRNEYSIDPIRGCYEHINKNSMEWVSIFDFGINTLVLRWNQHLMKYNPQPYYYIRHTLREFKNKFLHV